MVVQALAPGASGDICVAFVICFSESYVKEV